MDAIKKLFAQKLMDIKAIKLQPEEPFTWASGWKSPIYTDNRKTLGFADVRSFVKLELCHTIQENFPEAEAVAGVAFFRDGINGQSGLGHGRRERKKNKG